MNEIKPVKHICFMLRVYVYWLHMLSVDDVFFVRLRKRYANRVHGKNKVYLSVINQRLHNL